MIQDAYPSDLLTLVEKLKVMVNACLPAWNLNHF